MANEKLSLAIARHFEPEPKWDTADIENGWSRPPVSKGGFWTLSHMQERIHIARSHREPEVAMMLLKALQSGGVLTIGKQEVDAFAQWFVGVHTRPFEFAGELEDAIALAFIAAHKLEVV